MRYKILFDGKKPISSTKITHYIDDFGDSYNKTVRKVIKGTNLCKLNKNIFLVNSATLLNNFGMARSGPFKSIRINDSGRIQGPVKKLEACWDNVKGDLLSLRRYLNDQNIKQKSRTLVSLDEKSREKVITDMWSAFKKILPITMGKHSFGLVGASKILFSVYPEIVLPVDNAEWLQVFQTVDMGDVITTMTEEILEWEQKTGEELQSCDRSEYTTLPAVYNVMAMQARP